MQEFCDYTNLERYDGRLKSWVLTRVKPLTKLEYETLSEEEKQADIVYILTDQVSNGNGSGNEGSSYEEVYSTGERVIGKWVDGKPLYQRTFLGTVSSSGTFPSISLEGVKTWVSGSGWIIRSDKYQYPIPAFYSPNDFIGVLISTNGRDVIFSYGGGLSTVIKGASFHITFKYTKSSVFSLSNSNEFPTSATTVGGNVL